MPEVKIPKYCCHKRTGIAYVTINGKQISLGIFGTRASREEYDRVIAEFLANHRQTKKAPAKRTIAELIELYLEHAREWYRKNGELTSEYNEICASLNFLLAYNADMLADEFTVTDLEAIQRQMVDYRTPENKPHAGSAMCRNTINRRLSRIIRSFKWGGKKKIVSPSVYHEISLIDRLQKGRTKAKDHPKVKPVSDEIIEKTIRHCSPVIADMVRVQHLTGMRPQDVTGLRNDQIDRSRDVWRYDPPDHKTAHHDKEHPIPIGPRAQAILTPYLMDAEPLDGETPKPIFSPAVAVKIQRIEKRLNRQSKITPSQIKRAGKKKLHPRWYPRDAYTTDSYRQAIQRACDKAGVPRWSPNQLRHNAGTKARKEFGLDGAQALLGHSNAKVTEIYAALDYEKAEEIARKIG